jgi:hypothetical protein
VDIAIAADLVNDIGPRLVNYNGKIGVADETEGVCANDGRGTKVIGQRAGIKNNLYVRGGFVENPRNGSGVIGNPRSIGMALSANSQQRAEANCPQKSMSSFHKSAFVTSFLTPIL